MNQDRDKRTKLASWDEFQYDQLRQIPRELRFFPSDAQRAKSLSSEQIDPYNREGFLTGIRLFDVRETAEIRDLLLHGSAANGSQRRRCGLTMRYAPSM